MTVFRYDTRSLGQVTETSEGYLTGYVAATRTGIFNYQSPDGSVHKELRHPDDVFSKESLDTLSMIPITDGHPSSPVDAQSARDEMIGSTGEMPYVDGKYIMVPIKITDAETVEKVKQGKNEVSLGYIADVQPEASRYDGIEYDARQRNIRYNHLSIVDKARAGSQAKLNLDSADAVMVDGEVVNNNERFKTMDKVKIDGLEYEAAPEVKNYLTKLEQKVDEHQAAFDQAQKDKESLEGERDTLKEKVDSFEGRDLDQEIQDAAEKRLELAHKAAELLPEDKQVELYKKDERQLQEMVIAHFNAGAELTEKSDEYVKARFDAIVEMKPKEKMSSQRQQIAQSEQPKEDGIDESWPDPKAARQKMIDFYRSKPEPIQRKH